MRGRGDLFDVVGVQVHAEHVREVVVLKQDALVALHAINAEKNHLIGGGPGVQHVGDPIVVHLQLEPLADGTSVQKVLGPVGAAEIHLMQRTSIGAHQAPLQAVGRDVKSEVRRSDVFHDGPCVPSGAVVVGLALLGVSPHLEVVPVSVQHTRSFVGGDADGAVHQRRCGSGRYGVDEGGGPKPGGAMNGGSNRAFLRAPAKVCLVVPSEFHVGRAVMLTKREVQHLGAPQVEHRLFTDRNLNEAVDIKGRSGEVVAVT